MRPIVRQLRLWGPAIAYMAVIFIESSMSDAPLPSRVNDKVAHAGGYALLGVLCARALAGGFAVPLTLPRVVAAVVIAALYGASDEWHQAFVPGRSSDIRDWYADVIGASVGAGLVWACGIIWPRVGARRASSHEP